MYYEEYKLKKTLFSISDEYSLIILSSQSQMKNWAYLGIVPENFMCILWQNVSNKKYYKITQQLHWFSSC